MNKQKPSSSEIEKADDSMEWAENEGIKKLGPGIGDKISSIDPNAGSGYSFSQPRTSGYTGQKRKYFFSNPLPAKIPRDNGPEIQQKEEHPTLNKTNPNNKFEVTSGFSIAPPIPQMMQVDPSRISNQANSENISEVLTNDGTDCSKGDISTGFLHETDPDGKITSSFSYDELRKKIINLLDKEEPLPGIEDILSCTKRLNFLYQKEKIFSNNFKLPRRSRSALQTHLRYHGIDNVSVNFGYFEVFIHARESKCLVCGIFFGFLAHPNLPPESDIKFN